MINPSPIPTQVEAESVDTPEFRNLLYKCYAEQRGHAVQDAFIAHIDSIITARVAAKDELIAILRRQRSKYDGRIIELEAALAASQSAPAKAEGYVLVGYVPKSSMDALEVAPHASICCLSRNALPPGPVEQVAVYVAAPSTLPEKNT